MIKLSRSHILESENIRLKDMIAQLSNTSNKEIKLFRRELKELRESMDENRRFVSREISNINRSIETRDRVFGNALYSIKKHLGISGG